MLRRSWVAVVMIAALTAQAEPTPLNAPGHSHALSAVLIGAVGLALAGGYATAAVLTGDKPSAVPLAITGGVLSSGLLVTAFSLAVRPQRKDAADVLIPLICGVVSAVLGGLVAGYFSQQPGTARIVTHAFIITFLVVDTLEIELANLARW